ncbi:MAG: dTDP-4-dehydrorhamnose reductase [Prevotellaceae bacterium]|nr:dTDP-4-dehydrorhamnose reductase [Prevotellaceae bacterium]
MKKNILITGSNGQLGSEIRSVSAYYQKTYNFIFTDVAELDITNIEHLRRFLQDTNIEFVVNCAAYTAVDRAEDDVQMCYKINRDAVKNLAECSALHNINIIHISTDYVFDGKTYLPYTEEMTVSPASVYGKSKVEGEIILQKKCPNAVIIRTSWLYSSYGNNFVKTMLKLGKERESLNVIVDQTGTPTYAADLADVIMQIIDSKEFIGGIYHFSNEGAISWYDFAKAIHRIAKTTCKINPIETKDYPARAPRPHYSVLNKSKLKQTYKIEIPYWEDSLQACISKLQNQR